MKGSGLRTVSLDGWHVTGVRQCRVVPRSRRWGSFELGGTNGRAIVAGRSSLIFLWKTLRLEVSGARQRGGGATRLQLRCDRAAASGAQPRSLMDMIGAERPS